MPLDLYDISGWQGPDTTPVDDFKFQPVTCTALLSEMDPNEPGLVACGRPAAYHMEYRDGSDYYLCERCYGRLQEA